MKLDDEKQKQEEYLAFEKKRSKKKKRIMLALDYSLPAASWPDQDKPEWRKKPW